MSTVAYDYEHWAARLEGKPSKLPDGIHVGLGFYRMRQRDGAQVGVAIWEGSDGRPVVKTGSGSPISLRDAAQEEDFSFNKLAWCKPVTEEAYRGWAASGKWPDDLPDMPALTNGEPHVIVKETIAEVRKQAEDWLAEIGGEVKTQEQADKAANFADRFHELSKEAETQRTAEKEPVLKLGKEIDGRWNEVRDAGKAAKVWAQELVQPFLQAEQARRLAAAAEKAAAGGAVRDVDTKVKAGTRGRSTSLRTTQKAQVSDYAAAFTHYRDLPRFRDLDLVKVAIDQLATADLKAGHEVPGAKLIDVQTAHS